MSLLDDLMEVGEGDGPAAAPPRRPRWVRVASLLLFAAMWTVAGYGGLLAASLTVPLAVLAAASVTLVATWRLARRVRPAGPAGQAPEAVVDDSPPVPDGLTAAVDRWESLLGWCQSDAGRFNRRMQARLAEVVDGRLRQRYGFTRVSDPRRARAVLGEPVWQLLTEPVKRAPSARDLGKLVEVLEKL